MSPPSSTPTAAAAQPPQSEYNLEFRAKYDDAWYSVRTVLAGDRLTVKYFNFNDDEDSVFEPQNFTSLAELDGFVERFRPVSVQLQDSQCKKVRLGTVVCASHSTGVDFKYYDAVVDEVIVKDHSFAGGEEECTCTFVVVWQHGPREGCFSNKMVENICVVQSNAVPDSSVARFAQMVRKRLGDGAIDTPHQLGDAGTPLQEIGCSPKNLTFTQRLAQRSRCAVRSSRMSQQFEEKTGDHSPRDIEDVDMGGDGNYYIMLLDNLDKDLYPATLVEFIRRQTSISVQAFVFPSSRWETYTKGAIAFDCHKNLEKVCALFDSPNHIVISQRGRPCVVIARLPRSDMIAEQFRMLMLHDQDKLLHGSVKMQNGLKLVDLGSEEYKTAKKMKEMFLEFVEHQQRLHQRLTTEERKFLLQSQVV